MTRLRFDPKLIPGQIALDTGIVLRAMGHEDDKTNLCAEFVRELVNCRVEIQVAAPVIAEVIRGDVKRTPQSMPGIVVTAFDDIAAIKCGQLFPVATLNSKVGNKPPAVLKYDAMIIACAVRWGAKHLVSFDAELRKKATSAGVAGKEPSDYLAEDLFNLQVIPLKKG